MTAALAVGTPGAPSLAFDNGPRIGVAHAPAASAPPAVRPSIGSVTINVNAQPGQSARDIAREVAEMLNNPNLGELGDEPGDFD